MWCCVMRAAIWALRFTHAEVYRDVNDGKATNSAS